MFTNKLSGSGCLCLLNCIVEFAGAAGMDLGDSDKDFETDFKEFLMQELLQYFVSLYQFHLYPPTAS